MDVAPHNHPDIEDRITAEMTLVRTEVAGVSARVELLRQDVHRGFTNMTQVLGQILARLPEADGDASAT